MTGPPPPQLLSRAKLQIEIRSNTDFFIRPLPRCISGARSLFRLFRSGYFGEACGIPKRRLRFAIMERNRVILSAGDNLASVAMADG